MPLSPPHPRQLQHQRRVYCDGYEREDGYWDIEGRMTDIKTRDVDNRDRGGRIAAGEPIHDMSIRLTIDLDFVIHEVEAVIDYSPFSVCPSIVDNFRRLKGKRIGPGWTRLTKEMFSGTQGCTHLMELLGPVATTAFQSTYFARTRKAEQEKTAGGGEKPHLLNTCHALAEDGEVVRDFWPEHYQPK